MMMMSMQHSVLAHSLNGDPLSIVAGRKATVTLIRSFSSKISSPLNHSDPRCEVSTASLPEAVLGRMDLTGHCHATKKSRLAECKLCAHMHCVGLLT
jgi:hypothetical protein